MKRVLRRVCVNSTPTIRCIDTLWWKTFSHYYYNKNLRFLIWSNLLGTNIY